MRRRQPAWYCGAVGGRRRQPIFANVLSVYVKLLDWKAIRQGTRQFGLSWIPRDSSPSCSRRLYRLSSVIWHRPPSGLHSTDTLRGLSCAVARPAHPVIRHHHPFAPPYGASPRPKFCLFRALALFPHLALSDDRCWGAHCKSQPTACS